MEISNLEKFDYVIPYEKVRKIVSMLKGNLGVPILVGGSLGLRMQGYYCEVPSMNDLDLICIIIPEEKEKVNTIAGAITMMSPNHDYDSCSKNYWLVNHQFVLEGIKVDLFIEECKDEQDREFRVNRCLRTFNGLIINPIQDIVEARKKMNRFKDRQKAIDLISWFIKTVNIF